MIRFLPSIIAIILASEVYPQKWDKVPDCSSDTVVEYSSTRMKDVSDDDSFAFGSSEVIRCKTRSIVGFRFEVGFSNYYYGEKTSEWIGQNGGLNINFILAINKINFGFRFKPQTLNPQIVLEFDNTYLPTSAKLNNIRLDYYVGYSVDFNKLFSIEPYVGYNSSTFLVINEEELNQTYSSEKTGGFILGTTLNKYFKIGGFNYISIFGSVGYAFVNYEKVHPYLDNGYFEWNVGVAYKVFATKRISQQVN